MTLFTYNGNNKIATLTANNATTGNQETQWIYGTTTATSGVASDDWLAQKGEKEARHLYA